VIVTEAPRGGGGPGEGASDRRGRLPGQALWPFSELLARVQALIRRSTGCGRAHPPGSRRSFHKPDHARRLRGEKRIELQAARQFPLLEYCCATPAAWSPTHDHGKRVGLQLRPPDQRVESRIYKLREKIDKDFPVKLITRCAEWAMSSKRLRSIPRTLALPADHLYAGIFFSPPQWPSVFFTYLITTTLRGAPIKNLLAEVRSFSSVMVLQGARPSNARPLLDSQAAGEKKSSSSCCIPTVGCSPPRTCLFPKTSHLHRGHRPNAEQKEPLFATVSSPDHRHEIRVVYALLGPGLIIHLGQAMTS